jgi:DeoR/GlpR family transcriptional regulator of sugar metabolism
MQVLLLMADGRELGPSEVANHVRSSLTTAYRDLTKLEQDGLITYTARGKRVISEHGQAVVAHVLSGLQ